MAIDDKNAPYNDRITGSYYTLQGYTTDAAQPLASNRPCLYVNLIVPEIKPDGTPNNDLYSGSVGGQWKARLAGTESGDKPIRNLNLLYVRSLTAGQSCFYFVEVYY